ncbi:GIY-YIG nuclease family protein [Pseudaeromonas sharmana]|uniref:GIY-YIG nuclease family protein n=1 Tax=Pseudaeromonas sharmana TaxID=328412 RepID=A0ABV8CIR9_9GAMM
MSDWHLYLIRDRDQRLYTGISRDVERRLVMHQNGTGARALRGRGPLTLVWRSAVISHREALRLEYAIKQWPKARKEALIRGEVGLPELA